MDRYADPSIHQDLLRRGDDIQSTDQEQHLHWTVVIQIQCRVAWVDLRT